MPQPLRVFDYSISIHALLAESDRRCSCCPPLSTISIHALLAESDTAETAKTSKADTFLSTLSLRRATSWRRFMPTGPRYFYPRSPCGERPNTSPGPKSMTPISIHALLAESDILTGGRLLTHAISIHALLAESDPAVIKNRTAFSVFLSTLSLRRATAHDEKGPGGVFDFYPRSPCGERPMGALTTFPASYFYPRSPCGERHWPRVMVSPTLYFYPRSPCGERLTVTSPKSVIYLLDFYPRSPCGERRRGKDDGAEIFGISIHALLAESDLPGKN